MSKVFISYARDGGVGENLATLTQPQLQSAGHTVFRDVTNLNPGDRWDTKLEFELETSDIVVLIVSEKVRRSEWVHNEISMAKEIDIPIIPVLSEKIRMPLWLRHLQALDFSEKIEWESLLSAISIQTNLRLEISWDQDSGEDEYGRYLNLRINDALQRFRYIEAGTFCMGSPVSESQRNLDEVLHKVTLDQPFWLADSACTQSFWQAVTGNNPSHFKDNLKNPVEQVSWDDINGFIEKLNSTISGLSVRLPSEAQWEYACRAETKTPFSFGENIRSKQVNYDGSAPYNNGKKSRNRERPIPVKSLPANRWGLYEMHGNILEWCQDTYKDDLGAEFRNNPLNGSGEYRVLRGGSWIDVGMYCRSASRFHYESSFSKSDIGFRLSLA